MQSILTALLLLQISFSGVFAVPVGGGESSGQGTGDPQHVKNPEQIKELSDSGLQKLGKQQVPSIREFQAMAKVSRCTEGKVPIFFSGWNPQGAGYLKAKQWARQKFGMNGFAMYDSCIPDEHYRTLYGPRHGDPRSTAEEQKVIIGLSQTFARMSRRAPVAWLFMEVGKKPGPASYFTQHEAPYLTHGPGTVGKIEIHEEAGHEETYWKQGDPPIGHWPIAMLDSDLDTSSGPTSSDPDTSSGDEGKGGKQPEQAQGSGKQAEGQQSGAKL
ncbi:MAG: hypothetical protein M1821_007579 [Bathelium mastoideum]|nr:MAG: hypothetical protein M1821_007579 [Bathelium mastoideum]KAI9675476.1 MAG: hypothetical protein M1822_008954 [Bathelium mastoideum]